jgi:ABC-type Zn uptake system ZnuABC Zn-binding protein ZnuA
MLGAPEVELPRLVRQLLANGLLAGLALGAHAAPLLPVVTTIEPLAMLVREVGGDRVEVAALVPPAASPHTYDPLPSDVARLFSAALLVEVGGDVDGWTEKLHAAAAPRAIPTLTLLAVSGLDPIPSAIGETERLDPHVWLDPIRVRDVVAPALAARLAELDPEGRETYASRLEALRGRLTALDAEIRDVLEDRARRYVAFHAAWRYFGARYGLQELGVVEEAPGEEPTPRELARLVENTRAAGVPAILIEPQLPSRVARSLADEVGAELVVVDPNGDPRDPARARYEDLMRFNARAFARALGPAR